MEPIKIYFAGKVLKGGGYRESLIHSRVMSEGEADYQIEGISIRYIGPFAIGCDHGCYHSKFHGLSWVTRDVLHDHPVCQSGQMGNKSYPKGIPPEAVAGSCVNQIRRCDLFYAYIDSLDCYGTIAEIAIASENKKKILIEIDKKIEKEAIELWFSLYLQGVTFRIVDKPELAAWLAGRDIPNARTRKDWDRRSFTRFKYKEIECYVTQVRGLYAASTGEPIEIVASDWYETTEAAKQELMMLIDEKLKS